MVDVLALGSTDDVLATGIEFKVKALALALGSRCWHCVRGVCIVFEVFALCSKCWRCVRGIAVVFKALTLWSCRRTRIAIHCYHRTVVGLVEPTSLELGSCLIDVEPASLSQRQGVEFVRDKGGQRGGKGETNSRRTT